MPRIERSYHPNQAGHNAIGHRLATRIANTIGADNLRAPDITTGSPLADIRSITAGGGHTCALLTNGTAKCWGYNYDGRVGDGTTTNRLTPTTVTGLTGATAITAGGGGHSCALLTNGTAKCWGNNGSGQLGDGTTTNRLTPTTVTGLTGATAITPGGGHSCALLTNGTAKCWGNNVDGQLGDGTTTNRLTPVTVLR
ncbi:MAG: hypothetical protein KF906_05575 [Actinobacteria bacterium]|nr:hypothetical protein [Actinomycetota bacterium]